MRFIKNSEELGRNLKEARESRNLTQQKMADMLHVDRSMISYYERGRVLPTVFQLIHFSKQLKIKLTRLLTVNKTSF